MRRSSGRALTATALVAGLAVLVVAGRLLPVAPGTPTPTTPTTLATSASPASGVAQTEVPNAVGQLLAQAKVAMREAGLQGVAADGDPQGPAAVVIAQEPGAGQPVDAGAVIGLRTIADIVPNGAAYRVLLEGEQATAIYLIRAPDPARHALTVAVAMPSGADVVVALEPGHGQERLVVLFGAREPSACPRHGGRIRCVVRFGALEALAPGRWIVSVANRSQVPTEVTVTVTFSPL